MTALKIMSLQDPELYLDPDYVASYDTGIDNYWSRLCRQLVAESELGSAGIVADLGCGTGYVAREIAKEGVPVIYAIDPSRPMLDIMRKRGGLENAVVIEGTIDDLISSELEKPDVILASGAFVVMQNPAGVLEKIYSYLGKGRRFIFTVEDWANANIEGEPLDLFFKKEEEYKDRLGLPLRNFSVTGGFTYSPEEVKQAVADAGGQILKFHSAEMSHAAESCFSHEYALSSVNSDIEKLELGLKDEGTGLGRTSRILKTKAELDKLKEQRKLLLEFKALYAGKEWVVGTQHVFHTVKI
ncbi:MAG: class I SAM-dependent methyltransferase [Nanoarchaeota archaeon]|nr:class I SAM-dependent methyltransferase [Nanoarchaeota archaeon]